MLSQDAAKPQCFDAFTISNVRLHSPPPPPFAPPPPPSPLTYERGVAVGFSGALLLVCFLLTLGSLARRAASAARSAGAASHGKESSSKSVSPGVKGSDAASRARAKDVDADTADASPLMSPERRGDGLSVLRMSEDGEMEMELPSVTLPGNGQSPQMPRLRGDDFEYF